MEFARWLRQEAFTASALDPEAPLDELESLRALIGEARVVAIGENAHHVREFYLLRHRLLRFLVERCGFTGYVFEAPRVESEAIDSWVRGASGDLAELTGTPAMALTRHGEMHAALAWMRAHNAVAERPVRFAGAVADVVPELRRVRTHLRHTDPGALPLLERALAAACAYQDEYPMRELFNYAALEQSTRDALTADLSRLLGRMEATSARTEALARVRAAWHADHLYRDFSGSGLSVGTTALDTAMAETVLRLLDEDPGAKIVLALHNVHLRATPVEHGGPADILPAGYHLRAALGEDYVAIAATGNHGSVACGELNPGQPSGMDVVQRPLPPPEPGSIEAAFAEAAIDDTAALAIADLRAANVEDAGTYTKFRSQEEFLGAPVFRAFDAVAYVPHLRPAS
ncbi:erythromycin esterase [Prauserella marina]|uniref:Erythromycin esterase n=1 Tax=Prauserella marina TaxID=530584 RepID=A0A1G6JWP1_9PSEU|nr:erythromycin esterase family protein [Prauserella marina]PWV84412.1 erythromycin esterase [Prauserella marina]SDC23199.1 erythromycin esterase [Prauserella marina]